MNPELMLARRDYPQASDWHGGLALAQRVLRPKQSALPVESDSFDIRDAAWAEVSQIVHSVRTTFASYRLAKRMFDLSIVLFFAPFLFPIFAVVALVVKLSSRGPVFFRHGRVGQFGKPFNVWKFRTMHEQSEELLLEYFKTHPEAEREWKQSHKLRFDPRITRLGRVLRKTSLDELPQLWNVLIGDMSLVGPRPIVKAEIAKYGERFFFYSCAKPGVTGLWQVSGRSRLSYDERTQLDERYVRQWRITFDLRILVRTVRMVFLADGAY